MVAGGKLLEELNVNSNFQQWYGQAVGRRLAISTTAENDIDIESIIEDLTQQDICASDDYHILALAKVTGARLLYTQDKKLRSDFKEIVKGRVYPSGNSKMPKGTGIEFITRETSVSHPWGKVGVWTKAT